ncbi:hypothetical protein SCLCIDRAFT_1206746 [Scleroderma citrinum Foug A]|uniref:Uncharacterized protein n=1 Tax=Scleroderma citrinum Foug A TaxID=1036808 RepID=A0A0C3AA63_9AGAM|nr:hypothetical protein SCLCIDRAFT_1206746 [Scleroderma citrinum Foug A]
MASITHFVASRFPRFPGINFFTILGGPSADLGNCIKLPINGQNYSTYGTSAAVLDYDFS